MTTGTILTIFNFQNVFISMDRYWYLSALSSSPFFLFTCLYGTLTIISDSLSLLWMTTISVACLSVLFRPAHRTLTSSFSTTLVGLCARTSSHCIPIQFGRTDPGQRRPTLTTPSRRRLSSLFPSFGYSHSLLQLPADITSYSCKSSICLTNFPWSSFSLRFLAHSSRFLLLYSTVFSWWFLLPHRAATNSFSSLATTKSFHIKFHYYYHYYYCCCCYHYYSNKLVSNTKRKIIVLNSLLHTWLYAWW